MRRLLLVLALAFPAAGEAAAAVKALSDFPSGRWRVAPVRGGTSHLHCLSGSDQLITGGRPAPGCHFSVISDTGSEAVVTYRCGSRLSGRTELRRDAMGIYTIDAQGVESGRPFGSRAEWRHSGTC